MGAISNTLRLLQFTLVIFQANSTPQEPRLLGATQLTKEQIVANHKGSASVALAYLDSIRAFKTGVLITPDKFLALYSGIALTHVIASNLVQPAAANPPVADGEVYPTTDPSTSYNGNEYIRATKFGPLKSDTKAVPATLAPAGSPPLSENTKGCIAYTYGPNTASDTNPEHFKLGYLPFKVVADSICAFDADAQTKYFCATLEFDGKSPICNPVDFPTVAFCPVSTFGGLKSVKSKVEGDREKWCLFWWFWWCQEENIQVPEEKYVLVGITAFSFASSGCGLAGKATLGFYYTKNIN